MCLYSIKKDPHVLKRDRRCWKVVYKYIENGRLKPIYYDENTEYRLNAAHVESGRPDVKPNLGKTGTYEVGAGFVHAFISLDKARTLRQEYDLNEEFRVPVVCECVIPAGTEVYSNRDESEVCARKMRFDKILTP